MKIYFYKVKIWKELRIFYELGKLTQNVADTKVESSKARQVSMYVCKPISFSQREDNDTILLCIGFQLEIAIFVARLGLDSTTCPSIAYIGTRIWNAILKFVWVHICRVHICMSTYLYIGLIHTYIVQFTIMHICMYVIVFLVTNFVFRLLVTKVLKKGNSKEN